MYRRSLALLWTGTATFASLAITDAFLDFMGNAQGLFIGFTATCLVCACILYATRAITAKLLDNHRLSGDVHHHIEQLKDRVTDLEGKVGEVRDLTEGAAMIREAERNRTQQTPEPAEQDATIYQFQLRDPNGTDIIIGSRTREPINEPEIWAALEDGTGTLPGTSAS